MAVSFERVSSDEWTKLEASRPKPKENTRWDELIDAVIDGGGEVISIAIDGKDSEARKRTMRGNRIGIARRASKRNGVRFEFRNDAEFRRLLIRLSDKPLPEPKDPDAPKRGPGRPKKNA